MVRARFQLFGKFQLTIDGKPIDHFATDKIRALLAYLAAEADQVHARTQLATLLWGEWDEAAAKSNLRKSLSRLRKTLGPIADDLLSVTRQSVQLLPASIEVDLLQFEHLAHEETIPALQEAVDLYQGELLAGLALADAPSFDEWLVVRREQLHQQLLIALQRLAALYLAQDAFEAAQTAALRQLALEPWHEAAHRQLIQAYAAAGQRAKALAQYESCRQVLQDELGVEPAAETERLMTVIRQERSIESRLHHFPPSHTAFIGRQSDVEHIIARLNDPQTRLITVSGPGGIGKTRLAIEAVTRSMGQADSRDAYFFSLSELETIDRVWQILAERLGVMPGSQGLTPTDVIERLQSRPLLLVLDNYEQFLPDTSCIEEILAQAPDTCLLVTSRIPLSLRAEWRLPLDGLAIPPPQVIELERYAAVNLLVNIGKQVRPTFELTSENRAAIGRICRALGGMPLALEMAGSWLGLMSAAMLADQIDQNLDFLVATRHDLPARHRSLRAVFDHALAQLSGEARALLNRLTCFQGAFSLPAAMTVVSAGLPHLNTLVDHVLVQRVSGGRFGLHPVLRSFLQEGTLALQNRPEAAEIKAQHAKYYLRQVAQASGSTITATVAAIGEDLANVRAAWEWAVAEGDVASLAAGLEGLLAYYQFRGAYDEGRRQFAAAVRSLAPSELVNRLKMAEATCAQKLGDLNAAVALVQSVVDSEISATQLPARISLGRLYERQGEYDLAVATLQEALPLTLPDSDEVAQIYDILGTVYRYRGALQDSIGAYLEALRINTLLGKELAAAENHANVAISFRDKAAYPDAFAHVNQALAIARQYDHREYLGRFTHYLGIIYWQQDDLDQAAACFSEALQIAEELNHKRTIAICLSGLGVIASRRFDYQTALRHYKRGLQLTEQLGERSLQALMLGNSGNVYRFIGQYSQAIDHYKRAAALDEAAGAHVGVARHLANIGDAFIDQGNYREALPYLAQALPVMRESANSYYLCWILTSYATCLLETGQLAEAERLNEEGGRLAHEIQRESYEIISNLLQVRLLALKGRDDEALAHLDELQHRYADADMSICEVLYTRWQITGDPADRAAAAQLFAELYERTHWAKYRDRL